MGMMKWAALAAAGASMWAAPASADELVYQRTETVLANGFFDSPFNPLEFGQGYQLTIVLPGTPTSWSATVQWSGNHEEYFEAGGYDLQGSNNSYRYLNIPLTLNGNVLTGTFTSLQNYTTYWPNGNVQTMYIGFADQLFYQAHLDPSFTGADVYVTLKTVPEPGTWVLMIAGFGLAGAALRRRPTNGLA